MFHKDTFRLIKKTAKRFVTILLIVLIGASFMVGLMSSEPTMLASVDKYYDDTQFMDLQLFSSYGFDNRDITALKGAKNVKNVVGTKFIDAYAYSETGGIVTRIQELSCDMNTLTLTEGRMPKAKDEALALGSSSFGSVFSVGDVAQMYLEGDEPLSDSLAVTDYKIVGIVKTPQYMASSRETSTLNNLSLSTVIFVDNTNFLNDYYTSLYLSFDGAAELTSFTDQYKEFIEDKTDGLKKVIKTQEIVRRDEIIEEVQQEIADGEKELAEETAKAQKEIDDGRKKLEDAHIQLVVAESQISASETQIADGERQIAENQALMADSEAKLNAGKEEIRTQTGSATYREAVQTIETAYAGLTVYDAILDNTDPSYMDKTPSRAAVQMRADIATLRTENSDMQAVVDQKTADNIRLQEQRKNIEAELEILRADPQTNATEIAKKENELVIINETVTNNNNDIDYNNSQIAQNEVKITTLESEASMLAPLATAFPSQTLNEIKLEVDGQLNGDVGKAHKAISDITRGEAALTAGKAQLESAKAELASGKAQLESAKAQIVTGKADYEKGLKELEDGQKELDEEREKALIDIAKAKQELADLPEAGWTVLDRDMHYSTTMFESNASQMGKIGMVFPLLFFLVAALVCMTTMKRLVDEERSQIGIFSALGFTKGQIISKYVIYAFSAAISGSVVAIPLGMLIFPTVIYFCWRLMYDLPDMVLTMPAEIAVLGVCAFTFIMVGVTFLVVRGVLKENPSMLMRPKAPKNAKKVFLENIGFIWKRLSFTSKVTARNIIRYKSRFFMTVIGVAGCTGLLVLGFAIKDSVSQVVSIQYNDLILYDTTIVAQDSDDTENIMARLKDDSRITAAVPNLTYSAKAYTEDDEGTIQVYVADEDGMEEIFNLRSRRTKEPLSVKDGVIISEKFTQLYDISVGDEITLESSNGIKKQVEVSDICEMYAGHYLFISQFDYEDIFGETVYYDNIAVASSDPAALLSDFDGSDGVKTISDFTDMKATFNNMFDSLNIIIVVIILCAGSLALVVIMNLTEVNISERIREIATLKVLGFNNNEVYSYIFKEVFILSLIGIIIGLPLGRIELIFVMNIIDMEMIMFPTLVKPFSYAASFGITIAFTIIVIMLMRKTLRNVKMVESLKSVE